MPILREDDNILENFGSNEDWESILKKPDFEKDHTNLVGKNLNIGSYTRNGLLGRISLNKLLVSESSLSWKEVRFSKQEFSTGKSISDI